MDPINAFARQAATYETWLLSGADRDADAAREALHQLVELYRAALRLPSYVWISLEEEEEDSVASEIDRGRALEATRRLPLDFYGVVFDPTVIPPGQPVIGSLADDLYDIYCDVAEGLRIYARGKRTDAAWHWSHGLESHWGGHITGAIRALHWWLVTHGPEGLGGCAAGEVGDGIDDVRPEDGRPGRC